MEVEQLRAELARRSQERDELVKSQEHWQKQALTPDKRDRILAALGVGKQSPQYKRVKAVLDQLAH